MSDSYLRFSDGSLDKSLMTWPNPADPNEVEWRLRYQITFAAYQRVSDVLVAASFISAYRALIDMPQKTRNARIEQIKAAMQKEGVEE